MFLFFFSSYIFSPNIVNVNLRLAQHFDDCIGQSHNPPTAFPPWDAQNFSQWLMTRRHPCSSFTILVKTVLLGRGASLYFPRLLSQQFWKIVSHIVALCMLHGLRRQRWVTSAVCLCCSDLKYEQGLDFFQSLALELLQRCTKLWHNHPTALSEMTESAAKSAASVWLWRKTTARTKLEAHLYENVGHAELWALLFVFLFNMEQTFTWTYWHVDMLCQIYWSQVRWLTPNVLSSHVNFISWKHFANFCRVEPKHKH